MLEFDKQMNLLFVHSSEIVDQYNNNKKLLSEENYQISAVVEINDLSRKINKTAYKFLKKNYLEKDGYLMNLKVITSFLSFLFILRRCAFRACRIYEFLEDLKVSNYLQIVYF